MGWVTEFVIFELLIILGTAFLAIWAYFQYTYRYWAKKGVPYLEPVFPRGNVKHVFAKSPVLTADVQQWHEEFKKRGAKFGGVWAFSRKVLVILDPDYIRDILTKDFQYFVTREVYCNKKDDPRATHLFNITQDGWKSLRQKLTPTFTSGKMKMMFNSVLECSNAMIDSIGKCADTHKDVDIREVMASFTTDVIGNVAFGVECNSFDETQAEFRHYGKRLFDVKWFQALKIMMARFWPDLARKLGVTVSNKQAQNFFTHVVRSTIEYRRKNNIKRPDFLQLLIDMNAQDPNSDKYMSLDQIVANTVLFFIAGFDTSSTTMTFALYELSRNPEIQEKTRQEINNVLKKYNGQITYEALQEMTYLQQVIDESQRLWPPLVNLGRICTKNYTLRDTKIVLEKGTPIIISVLALGRDSDHFPNPEQFDPDRFTAEEKAKRHQYVHVPFGEGPRNCIGLRFGIMQSKIGIIRVLTNFKLTISPSTKMPLTIDPSMFLLKSNEILYLKATRI